MTRRCTQRQFLLRPSKASKQIFLFLLAVAARRYGVLIHAYCVMSNHVHIVLTDPHARLPAFHQFLDGLLARAMNAQLGRWESFWAPDTYSAVRLVSPDDVVTKTAYVLANPVKAGLVRSARSWPGAWSDPDRFGGTLEIDRPEKFFSAKGSMPETATLELVAPPRFASVAEFRGRVVAVLDESEREARRNVRHFLGVARVLAQAPFSRPASIEPRRRLNPRIAARSTWMRVEALAARRRFVREYRRAFAERRAGRSGVVFPAGTYQLRVMHGVPCAKFS